MIYFLKDLAYKIKLLLNFNTALIILIFSVLLISKLLFLDSDTVIITNLHNEDEGNYVSNIRNFIIEGKMFKDDTNFILLSPLYSAIVYIFVNIGGISIFNFRLTSAAAGILSIILLASLFKKQKRSMGIIVLLLLWSDFLFNIHSRIAMPEVTITLFFILTTSLYLKASEKHSLFLFFLTGLVGGLGFLVKSNAVVILGVCILSQIIVTLKTYRGLKNNIFTKFKELFVEVSVLIIGFIIPILYWYYFIILQNLEHYDLVKVALVQLHKPQIHAQLMDIVYLKNEFKEFFIGGEGTIWVYLAPYLILNLYLGIYAVICKKIPKDSLFRFAIIWFFIGNIYYFIMWYKPARWYVPNIVPIVIITTFLLQSVNKRLRVFLVLLLVGINLYLNYKFIYSKPTYFLKNASREIERIVGKDTYMGDSLVLMENKYSKAYNPYFIQQVYTNYTFDTFIKDKNFPKFICVGEGQYTEEIKNTDKYNLINIIERSSNTAEKRRLYVYTLK